MTLLCPFVCAQKTHKYLDRRGFDMMLDPEFKKAIEDYEKEHEELDPETKEKLRLGLITLSQLANKE